MGAKAIGSAAVLALLTAPAPAQEAEAEDIVVVARKLRKVRIDYLPFGRHLKRCDVTLSSGSARLDRIACAVVRSCVADGHTEPAAARTCFYAKVDSLAPGVTDIAYADAPAEPPPPSPGDTSSVEALDESIVVTGRRIEVRKGKWHLTRTAIVYPPVGRTTLLPPVKWTLCLADMDPEQAMSRLLGASLDRPALGCSRLTLSLKDDRVEGRYSCSGVSGSNDTSIRGTFRDQRLDVSSTISMEPGASTTPQKRFSDTTQIRARTIARHVGSCPIS